jgi:hypothetical protein
MKKLPMIFNETFKILKMINAKKEGFNPLNYELTTDVSMLIELNIFN